MDLRIFKDKYFLFGVFVLISNLIINKFYSNIYSTTLSGIYFILIIIYSLMEYKIHIKYYNWVLRK